MLANSSTRARVELFASIVSYFQNIVSFPQEATDGISDEQYVRNIVDALFRPKLSLKSGLLNEVQIGS